MTIPRIFQPDFQAAVTRLSVPEMGTEAVAPLLANLMRLIRPRRVLEVGMGYTTPFLAAELADLRDAARAEAAALAEKTRRHLADEKQLDDAWLLADPPLVTPVAHAEPYEPSLAVVDNLQDPDSSAGRVTEVLKELALEDSVTVVNADLKELAAHLPADFRPIDFAWVDAWECLYFFDHLMDLVNPDGGVVVMHYLMTYPEGEAVMRYIAEYQRKHPGELEVLNLLESHKLMQNSITVLSRTSGRAKRRYAKLGGAIDYGAELQAAARRQAGIR
ncbi:class I SAM-dependent methyltransferase [Streptomyces sp. NBC_01231]|nr:class I SAM-dependent methyltransferase [Streptomyces sp. NBC_01231]